MLDGNYETKLITRFIDTGISSWWSISILESSVPSSLLRFSASGRLSNLAVLVRTPDYLGLSYSGKQSTRVRKTPKCSSISKRRTRILSCTGSAGSCRTHFQTAWVSLSLLQKKCRLDVVRNHKYEQDD
jgi:hypothetical protein